MLLKFILWRKQSLRVFFEGAISMAADQDGCFLIKKRLYFSPQAKYLPI